MADQRRLSSQTMISYHKKFPAFCLAMFVLILVGLLLNENSLRGPQGPSVIIVLCMPLLVGGLGFLFARRVTRGVADDVFDGGDRLVFRWRDGREEQVPLADVTHMRYLQYSTPQKITLTVREAAGGKHDVSFVPQKHFGQALRPWVPNPIAQELVDRIKKAHGVQAPAV